MSHTYLITGGAGNLACQLSRMIDERGDRSVLFDIADGPVARTGQNAIYTRGDITDPTSLGDVMIQYTPTVIIHFASLLSGSTEADRALGWKINMDGGFALLEAALRHGVKRVFFPSSAAAYGGALPNPVPEAWPQWPQGLYGVTKMAMERLGHYYHLKHGLDFRSIRVPVVISPYAPAGAASAYASHAFIRSVQAGRFTFHVRPETSPSMIYVKDVLHAILKLLDTPDDRLTQRVYNIQAISPTAQELADAIRRRLPHADLRFEPDPRIVSLIESWPVRFDDRSARTDWGWSPQYDLAAMADDMIHELRK